MTKVRVTVNLPLGLHARPANVFVKKASQFNSVIKIHKENKEADAKRLLSVLSLGIRQGESIDIIAEGKDEKEAIKILQEMIENNFESK